MEKVMEGPTRPSNRPQHARTKRRKRIAQFEAARQRRNLRCRLVFQGVVVALALYAFTVIERMVG